PANLDASYEVATVMSFPPVRPQTGRGAHAPGHWGDMALQWGRLGPPLRPSAEDLGFGTRAVDQWQRRHGAPRGLSLGVTPELYHQCRAFAADLLAVDHTQKMIDAVWPGPPRQAVLADWTDMPLEAASRDLAFCDGGLQLLAYPHGYRRLVAELRRVL